MIDLIRPHLKNGLVLYSDMPGFSGWHGPSRILVTALKPDIFFFSQVSEEVIVLKLTCLCDANIDRSHAFKSEKYAPLIADLSQNYIVSFYSVEVSPRGQISS